MKTAPIAAFGLGGALASGGARFFERQELLLRAWAQLSLRQGALQEACQKLRFADRGLWHRRLGAKRITK